MQVIDGRARLATDEFIKFWMTEFNPAVRGYVDKYRMENRLKAISVEELVQEAKNVGVEKLVVYGSTPAENTQLIKLAKQHQSLVPIGGVNTNDGIRAALEEVTRLHTLGVAAIDFNFLCKKNVNDRDFYALYAYCEIHDLPVIIHSGIHYARSEYMWKAQPAYFDEIAVDFPDLKIIMSHGGNGFGPSVLAVTQRHPNIYLEFSAMRPKYMAPEFIQAANTYLKDRCIFGTDYPLTDFEDQINVWKYSLREDVWERFFYQNISTILKLK